MYACIHENVFAIFVYALMLCVHVRVRVRVSVWYLFRLYMNMLNCAIVLYIYAIAGVAVKIIEMFLIFR